MGEGYRLGKLRGIIVLVYYDTAGRRHRYRLGTSDAAEARRIAPRVYAELTKPRGSTVAELWQAYVADKAGLAVIATMTHTFKALRERFGSMPAETITIADSRAHTAERRAAGIKDGTIGTELGHLRMVLRWAERHQLIGYAPAIERPPKSKPKEDYLTREQCAALVANASMAHIRLYILLALGTGARNAALLGLTWDRVDLEKKRIDLRDPDITRPQKGRAIVPMTMTLYGQLAGYKDSALSKNVIEYGGKRVASVKRALRVVAARAGLPHVSPHMLRHSAAVHMAESGVPMSEISQFLGHSNTSTTEKIYARYSPEYLRKAATALEFD
jgi:integrase